VTHSATLLALDALAVFRLTRLVVADSITANLRIRASGVRPTSDRHLTGEKMIMVARPRLAEFLGCPWCVSPWLAAAVVACQALAPHVWLYAAAVLAFSAVAGLLAEHS
jgi:hypothetical protein